MDNLIPKVHSKPQLPSHSGKGTPVPDRPITDLVTPLSNIGKSLIHPPPPPNLRAYEDFISFKYRDCDQGVQRREE